jgi:dTDP-4-dehydrorhamnose 3,5-epimerase
MAPRVTITATEIPDVKIIESPVFADERGFFTESWSEPNWSEAGFAETFRQDNLSLSSRGALRGLHYQLLPHGMGKLVRCLRGRIFDVAVDLRQGSPTFGRWVGRELSETNHLSMWVPVGFAHGFLSLEDHSLVHYKCAGIYAPEAERALRWDDSEVGIAWPMAPSVISEKDRNALPLAEAETNFTWRD